MADNVITATSRKKLSIYRFSRVITIVNYLYTILSFKIGYRFLANILFPIGYF